MLTFCCGLPCLVSRILCWSPSRALSTMSSHLFLSPLLSSSSSSDGASTPFGTLMMELFQTVADIRMNEDLVLRGCDENPRRSRGKIASRLHRAGCTHDKTHRAMRIMRESERIRGGGEGRGGGTGTAAKSDRNAPRVAKFLTISRLDNLRLAARSTRSKYRGIATRHQATRTIQRKRVYAPVKMRLHSLATTRDSRGTNHHRLLTSGPPATPSVHSHGNER